jgi:hypothetical protein
LVILFIYFLVVLGFELRAYILSHSASLFLWWAFFFEIRSHELFAGLALTQVILLVSASWIARIIVMSHWRWLIWSFLR